MWRNFIHGKFLDGKKFEEQRVEDNMIHIVLPWHGWYLCCFVAKSVQKQFTLFCCNTYFVAIYALSMWRKIRPKILSVEKKDKYDVTAVKLH